jgi:hypothetical protein
VLVDFQRVKVKKVGVVLFLLKARAKLFLPHGLLVDEGLQLGCLLKIHFEIKPTKKFDDQIDPVLYFFQNIHHIFILKV